MSKNVRMYTYLIETIPLYVLIYKVLFNCCYVTPLI